MSYFSGLNKKIEKEKKPKIAKPKIWAIILTIVASIGYFSLFTNLIPFMKYFLLGTFGIFSYVMFTAMYLISGMLLKGKKYNLSKKYVIVLTLALISILSIFHMAFSGGANFGTYGTYLADIYKMQASIGGVLLGLIIYPLQKLLNIGAYILFFSLLIICVTIVYNFIADKKSLTKIDGNVFKKKPKNETKSAEPKTETINIEISKAELKSADAPIGLDAEILKEETSREIARKKLGLDRYDQPQIIDQNKSSNQLDTFKKNYLNNDNSVFESNSRTDYSGTFGYSVVNNTSTKQTKEHADKYAEYLKFMGLNDNRTNNQEFTNTKTTHNDYNSLPLNDYIEQATTQTNDKKLFANVEQTDNTTTTTSIKFDYSSPSEKNEFLDKLSAEKNKEIKPQNIEDYTNENSVESDFKNIIDNNLSSKAFDLPKSFQNETHTTKKFDTLQKNPIDNEISKKNEIVQEPIINGDQKVKIKPYHYVKPSLDLLSCISTSPDDYGGNVEETGRKIEGVLEEFKIPAKVIGITRGPAVTRYELEMPVGISVNKIPALEPDIKMRIATSKNIMIQAPIPGMSAFGIEVPNDKVATVSLKDILSSDAFINHKSPCAFGLGKEINGVINVCAVNKMPHVLIAGSTGSGKSVCLNSLILSILYKSSPEDVKFILIDPKRVEFSIYQGLPHLVIPDIISEPRKADNALGWAIKEMERRYALLEQNRVRNIDEYNNMQDVQDRYIPKMPYIVIIMDEFADMMQSDCKDIENKVIKLAAKARAAGIHLVLATQRPSVDVLSGTAKTNFPARIAFFLTSQTDSRTILGYGGAENLLGKGDMLYVSPGSNEGAKRLQGCFVSDDEVKRVVDFVINNNKTIYDESIEEEINKKKEADSVNPDGSFASYNDEDEEAEMETYAKDLLKEFIRVGRASASYIQRIKRVGFNKAARILDYLAKKKYISEGDGTSKPRAVYITKQQYIELFGDTDFDDHD